MPIFDQGYQHWHGQLSRHLWRWLTITRHGIRTQLKNRMLRLVMLVAWVPAIGLVLALVFWGLVEQKSDLISPLLAILRMPADLTDGARGYRVAVWTIVYQYFFQFEIFFAMILVVLVGPNLISQDLRFNAIPLYLSRPLRRLDYFVGKLGVIVWFLGLVAIVPAVVAYVMGIVFSLDPRVIWDTGHLLLASVGYGLVIAVPAGVVMLGLSSLTRRSIYVGAMWIGIWLIGYIMAGILSAIYQDSVIREAWERQAAEARAAEEKALQRQGQGGPGFVPPPEDLNKKPTEARLEAMRSDWRPLLSYTANVDRLGRAMLGSDAAWRKLASLGGPDTYDQLTVSLGYSQYPWYWSAFVLAGLMGLSAWVLTSRVKSLDRLR